MLNYQVEVPAGGKPGDVVTFTLPDGRPKQTQVPEGLAVGEKFTVAIPAPHPFPVVIPDGKKAGDEVQFIGPDGKERKAVVPENHGPGDTFMAMVYPSNSVEV